MQDYKWYTQRKMVRKVIGMLRFGPRRFRFGLVTFDRQAREMITLNQFNRARLIKMKMGHRFLKKSKHPVARIDLALALINNSSFSVENGARPNAQKIIVMLVHRDVTDFGKIRRESVGFREAGGRIILVTMGLASADDHNTLALALVAKEHISTHYTLKHLESTNRRIAHALCKASKLTKRQLAAGSNPVWLFERPRKPVRIMKYGPHMMAIMRMGTMEHKVANHDQEHGQSKEDPDHVHPDGETHHEDEEDDEGENKDYVGSKEEYYLPGRTQDQYLGKQSDEAYAKQRDGRDDGKLNEQPVEKPQKSDKNFKGENKKKNARKNKKRNTFCKTKKLMSSKFIHRIMKSCQKNIRIVVALKMSKPNKSDAQSVNNMLNPLWGYSTKRTGVEDQLAGITVVEKCRVQHYGHGQPLYECPIVPNKVYKDCKSQPGSDILTVVERKVQTAMSEKERRSVIIYATDEPYGESVHELQSYLRVFQRLVREYDTLVVPLSIGKMTVESELKAIATDPLLPLVKVIRFSKLNRKHVTKIAEQICHLVKYTKVRSKRNAITT